MKISRVTLFVLLLLGGCFIFFSSFEWRMAETGSARSSMNIVHSDTTPANASEYVIDGEEFLKPTQEAQFRGSKKKWDRYFESKMKSRLSQTPGGMCEIGFVIDENGNIEEVKALKMSSPAVAKAAIDIIKESGKWDPAELNGKKIKSYKTQNYSSTFSQERRTEFKMEVNPVPTHKGRHF